MSEIKTAKTGAFLLALLILVFSFAVFLFYKLMPFLYTPDDNRRLALRHIEKFGGLEKVNKEAKEFFDEVYYNVQEDTSLFRIDRKKYPIISSLGEFVRFFPTNLNSPAYIDIRYGSHFHPRSLYIFDPRKDVEWNDPIYIGLSKNIFLFYSDVSFIPKGIFSIQHIGYYLVCGVLIAIVLAAYSFYKKRRKPQQKE